MSKTLQGHRTKWNETKNKQKTTEAPTVSVRGQYNHGSRSPSHCRITTEKVVMYFVVICFLAFLFNNCDEDWILQTLFCSKSDAIRSVWTAFENHILWPVCSYYKCTCFYLLYIVCISVCLAASLANKGFITTSKFGAASGLAWLRWHSHPRRRL